MQELGQNTQIKSEQDMKIDTACSSWVKRRKSLERDDNFPFGTTLYLRAIYLQSNHELELNISKNRCQWFVVRACSWRISFSEIPLVRIRVLR